MSVPRLRIIALGTATAGAGTALIATSGWLVTRAAERPPVLALLVAIVVVRALGLVRAFARYGERLAAHDLAFRELAELRVRWYRRLARRVGGRNAPAAADLLSRFVADVDEQQHRYVRVISPPVVAAVTGLAVTVAATLILPAAGLVLGAGLLIASTVVPGVAFLAARGAIARQGAARAALADELVDALDAAPQLIVAGRAAERGARLDAASDRLARLGRGDAAAAALAQGLGTLVAGATLVGVIAVAIGPASDGALPAVWLGALALLALGAFEVVAPLPEAAVRAVGVIAARRRLDAAVTGPAAISSRAPSPSLPLTGTLIATGIRHRPGGPHTPLVLDGIDLRVEPGQRLAIIGPSGAGKTTLARLLAGLAAPDAGTITFAGVPLTELDPAALRERVRLADQDAHLFATSIANNVRIGNPHADADAIDAALRLTGLGPWLDALPDGADTLVGEQGFAVSGGQSQRIALARCLVSSAQLLVLDEPTAMLDPPAARDLLADIAHATHDRGAVVVTHQSAGLDAFDAVFALRAGRLTAEV